MDKTKPTTTQTAVRIAKTLREYHRELRLAGVLPDFLDNAAIIAGEMERIEHEDDPNFIGIPNVEAIVHNAQERNRNKERLKEYVFLIVDCHKSSCTEGEACNVSTFPLIELLELAEIPVTRQDRERLQ